MNDNPNDDSIFHSSAAVTSVRHYGSGENDVSADVNALLNVLRNENARRSESNGSEDDMVSAKAAQADLLRIALPACQPQEGSPANTFTESEKQLFLSALLQVTSPNEQQKHDIKPSDKDLCHAVAEKLDICAGQWEAPSTSTNHMSTNKPSTSTSSVLMFSSPQDGSNDEEAIHLVKESSKTVDYDTVAKKSHVQLDWFGAPRCLKSPTTSVAQEFRRRVRSGDFTGPTNSVCPGYLQCNLVVLPAGPIAFDFLLFCQRNPKACPLIEVCDGPNSYTPLAVAPTADLRTDVPQYAIYRNGRRVEQTEPITNVMDWWPTHAVAFLIGCSFSYDGALMKAGIPLRSAEAGRNVPMYKTNLKCRPAGSLHGHLVVSMKPIPATMVGTHCAITAEYPHAHGGPVCVGSSEAIGISAAHLANPEWGDAPPPAASTDVPVFHACGVTPQLVLEESKVPFAITHAAGHMFVTDLPSDYTGMM